MIHSKDRSGWFGASDTDRIMNRWDTPTFERFWLEKLGVSRSEFESLAMKTGTHLEGKVLDFLAVSHRDRQIRLPSLLLRVNLDGEDQIIHEVKTHRRELFSVTRPYWIQAQVEMYAARKPLEIVAYRVLEEDYQNWLLPIDPGRLTRHPVPYDREWVETRYLPRLRYLADCLRKGVWPSEIPC